MDRQQRKRIDPRREATRIALVEAAEALFAEAGVDAVSTRQIGAAIGSANTNVVAYHFGSKDALIEAVFRHRLEAIDRRRRDLLEQADASGAAASLHGLVRVFALPLFEQVNAEGRHSYARFLAGLEWAGRLSARALLVPDFPETERVIARMAALVPPAMAAKLPQRLRLATGLLTTALQIIDSSEDTQGPAARAYFESAMAMAAAAISAPPADEGEGSPA